jgi:UDP:flavonoid glycosyltransferase YjiC (YdhE family)
MIKTAGDEVFSLANDVPHDWLFERVSAVVHHGGAGEIHLQDNFFSLRIF